MKNMTITILAAGMIFTTSALLAQTTLIPVANFTLRDSDVNGTADFMDATPDHSGFDGFLTINSVFGEDRHFVEFNLSSVPAAWTSVTLRFTTAFIGSSFPPSTIQISTYHGNGIPDLSDWTIGTTLVTTIPGITRDGGQTFTLDVTSLALGYGGTGFMGFRFELLDSQLNQKALNASSIVLTQVPEPSSVAVGMMGLGWLALRAYRIRIKPE
jgi:hypothetical protein